MILGAALWVWEPSQGRGRSVTQSHRQRSTRDTGLACGTEAVSMFECGQEQFDPSGCGSSCDRGHGLPADHPALPPQRCTSVAARNRGGSYENAALLLVQLPLGHDSQTPDSVDACTGSGAWLHLFDCVLSERLLPTVTVRHLTCPGNPAYVLKCAYMKAGTVDPHAGAFATPKPGDPHAG